MQVSVRSDSHLHASQLQFYVTRQLSSILCLAPSRRTLLTSPVVPVVPGCQHADLGNKAKGALVLTQYKHEITILEAATYLFARVDGAVQYAWLTQSPKAHRLISYSTVQLVCDWAQYQCLSASTVLTQRSRQTDLPPHLSSVDAAAQTLSPWHVCRMHCQRLQPRCVRISPCKRTKPCARQITHVRTVLISLCLGQAVGRTQASLAQNACSVSQCRTSHLLYATASRNLMLEDLSQAVDLKQACLIAAGVYCLWRLASFFRYSLTPACPGVKQLVFTELLPQRRETGQHLPGFAGQMLISVCGPKSLLQNLHLKTRSSGSQALAR